MAKKAESGAVKPAPAVKNKSPREKYLRNVEVKVKPIVRGRAFFPKGHDGEFLYSGCTNRLTLPYSYSKRSYVNIFENDEEREFFEKALNKAPGALTIYDRNNDYWGKEFFVELDKNTYTINLNDPIGMLEYKVLLANKDKIAPTWAERNLNPGYKWAIVSSEQEDDDHYKLAAKNERAMELFFKIKSSNKKMYDVLRLLGKKPVKNSIDNTRWLKTQLDTIINQKERIAGSPNIDDFIKAVEDPFFSEKVFVFDAMDIGEVILEDGVYRIKETNAPIGRSIDQCVEYFADMKNNEDKILIKQRMELNK